ncbi:hypothetical protein [Streptacidiphilus melanogenes]|uniref:hypothetical protein n=1 Tax=Streptacidiphilus melanogenes TaxID=411235 RepID=UPI0005A960C4|nr:hypothetical protein [Streptacidiphilus melanogenes]
MYVREIDDTLRSLGITQLIQATEGLAPLPDAITSAHAELQDFLAQHATPHGAIDGATHQQAVTKLTDRLGQATSYGNATTLITDCLQPALTTHLKQFQQHVSRVGPYLHHTGSIADLLLETEEVRLAYVGLTRSITEYANLRMSWETLRGKGGATLDPQGTRGLIAEIRNAPEVFDDWRRVGTSQLHPWPWQGTNHWIRMSWLLDHGARVWLPTAAEQDAAYRQYVPAPRVTSN